MEQSPFAGYVKATMFALLAFGVLLTLWQRSKMEDKIVQLDRSVAKMDESLREQRDDTRSLARSMDELRGSNDAMVRLLTEGGARVATGGVEQPTGPARVVEPPRDKPAGWGWHLNAALDKDLDPSRPLGTPGRYKNFMTPDPAGSWAAANPPNRNGVLNLPFGAEPKGFNALLENDASLSDYVELYIYDAVGNRHWKRPSAFSQAPGLCWRVEASPDYKEYTLFFRRDAYWHEPPLDVRKYPHLAGKHPVTAHDLKFTVDIINDGQSNCAPLRSYYKDCSVEVIDDYTAVVRWTQTLFHSLSWTFNGYIMPRFVYAYDEGGREYPKESVGQIFNDHWFDLLRVGPVGNGPYRFVRYEPNKFIDLERDDDWYGFKDSPLFAVREQHLRIYRESEIPMNWGRAGELDIFGLNSTRYREWVLEETDPKSPFKDGRITTYKAPNTGYIYFGWKNTDPLFKDKRVRQAMTYACNREEICKKIFLGRYEPMTSPVYPASEEADPDLKPLPFDLDKARQLLEEAGWKINPNTGIREKEVQGRMIPFSFQLNWPGPEPDSENCINQYKNDLISIGIKMEPLSTEWAQFQKDLHDRKYNAFTLLWVVPGWEHDFDQIWNSRGIQDPGSSNYVEFSNPELDRLSDELRTLMDPQKRVEHVHRIGRILYEEAPYTFFGWRRIFRAYHAHVKGVEENPFYTRPLMRIFPFWVVR
jgi:peptide/nickel transport system substrate-binding protein